MNLSTGNLARMETSIFAMLLGSYMLFRKIWLPIYQSTSKLSVDLEKVSQTLFC